MNDTNRQVKIGPGLVLKSVSLMVFFVVLTVLLAGRLDYWQGWVFNGLNIFSLLVTWIVLRNQKDLIKERLKPGRGMKKWDRVYHAVSTPLYFVMFILSVLDAARFSWSSRVPIILVVVSIVIYTIGQIVIIWAKKANRFFSSVVRIQKDREQTVCTDGPYRYVRHPGYSAGLLYTVATPLLLGSFWGLLPVVPIMVVVIVRTSLEDKTLLAELAGYQDYARKVRYRLVPHIW